MKPDNRRGRPAGGALVNVTDLTKESNRRHDTGWPAAGDGVVCTEVAHDLDVRLLAQRGVLTRAATGEYDHVDPGLQALVPAIALAIVGPAHARLRIELGADR